jgi:outer membrane protein
LKRLLLIALLATPALAQVPASTEPSLPSALPRLHAAMPDQAREVPRLNLSQAYRLALTISPRASDRLVMLRRQPEGAIGKGQENDSHDVIRDFAFSPMRSELRQIEIYRLLIEGNTLEARLAQARTSSSAADQRLTADWQALCLEVRLAYLEVLRAKAQQQLAKTALTVASEQLKEVQARFDDGKVPRSDVLFATVPQNEASSDVQRAASNVQSKLERLNSVLGLPVSAPLQLVETELPEPITIGPARCVLEALALQPAARAERFELISQARGPEVAAKDSGGQLMALASMAALTDEQLAKRAEGTTTGLDLRPPAAEVEAPRDVRRGQRNKAPIVDLSGRLEDLRLRVEQQVRDAYRSSDLTAEVYNLGLTRVATAREAQNVAAAQYRAGLAPLSYVYQVQLELQRSLREQVDAFYDYLAARSRLDYARGIDPDPMLSTGSPGS